MNVDFDDISPITGNKCVVIEADQNNDTESYLCMESGYTTTDQLKKDSKVLEQYEQVITQLMIDAKFEDEVTGLIWYPAFMQMPGGMLFCKGESPKSFNWEVAKVVPIIGEERLKYPVIGKEGEYHTSRLDVDNAKSYNKQDFKSALDELYTIVKETIENENKLRNNSMQ